ncbi:Sphingosine kinase [Dirofilaria immitis]
MSLLKQQLTEPLETNEQTVCSDISYSSITSIARKKTMLEYLYLLSGKRLLRKQRNVNESVISSDDE